MRGFLLGALLAGTAAAAWFNPGNIMGKLGLKPLQSLRQDAAGSSTASTNGTNGGSTQVVKWKDANGNVVFGDANSAPSGSKAEKLKLNAPNLVSMPKAPPPTAAGENSASAQPAVEGVEMAPAPKPRNLALERMQHSLSDSQK